TCGKRSAVIGPLPESPQTCSGARSRCARSTSRIRRFDTMMVMHCAKKPLTVQLPARAPVISGTTEFRFPAPTRSLPPREAVTLPDETGKIVLERWGRMGLIEVQPGADPKAALLE